MYYLFITQDYTKKLNETFKLGMLVDEGKALTKEQLLNFTKEAFEGGSVELAAYTICKTKEEFLIAKRNINTVLNKIAEKVK